MSLLIPSYKAGFARCAAKAEYPGLWDGLVGAWAPFLGPTGLTLFDWAGRKNHGTLTNMDPATDWVASRYGGAVNGDANNNIILVSTLNGITPSSIKTMACWVNPSANRSACIIGRQSPSVGFIEEYGFGIYQYSDGTLRAKAASNNTEWHDNLHVALPNNTWSHAAFTITGSGANAVGRLYLNGQEVASHTGTASHWAAYGTALLGGYFTPESQYGAHFGGLLVNGGMWSGVLARSEIQDLYADPHVLFRPRRRVFAAAAAAGTIVPQMIQQGLYTGAI